MTDLVDHVQPTIPPPRAEDAETNLLISCRNGLEQKMIYNGRYQSSTDFFMITFQIMNDLRGKDSYPLKNGNKTASSDVLNYDDSPFTRFV